MDFREVDNRYLELMQRLEVGTLTDEEFDELLKELMVQDEEGRWWAKARTTGEWHYHNGSAWVKDTPPGYQAPQAAPEDQPGIQPQKATATGGSGQSDTEAARAEPPPSNSEAEELTDRAEQLRPSELREEQLIRPPTERTPWERAREYLSTPSQPLLHALTAAWWAVALRGLAVMIFGLLNVFQPQLAANFTLNLLAVWSTLMLADGVFAIIASKTAGRTSVLRIQGIIGSSAGLTAFLSSLTEHYFVAGYAIASWAICVGVIHIIVAARLGWEFGFVRFMAISGVMLVIFGGFVLMIIWGIWSSPSWLLGSWPLVSGISLVVFAFWVRNRGENRVRQQRNV